MVQLDPLKLKGPKLKLARAKRHLKELETELEAFFDPKPYSAVEHFDPKTGEKVLSIKGNGAQIPCEMSAIIGDVAHNLRAALDQLVCELIRDNRKQPRTRSGFPTVTGKKRFEEAAIGKIEGVSPATAKFIRRLKPYKGGSHDLWILHELDAMDKHVEIIPVVACIPHVLLHTAMPFSITPEGRFQIGQIQWVGGPVIGAKPVFLTKGQVEVFRLKPNPLQEINITIHVTLGKTRVLDGGEPVFPLLQKLTQLVERIIAIAERKLLRP